jgi:metal-responsive CopG/Arc/MetJ family transcriptional regulator
MSRTQTADSKRINVALPPDMVQKLNDLAKHRGTTGSHVVRQAIATEDYLRNEIKQGGRVLIEKPDGSLREIVFKD